MAEAAGGHLLYAACALAYLLLGLLVLLQAGRSGRVRAGAMLLALGCGTTAAWAAAALLQAGPPAGGIASGLDLVRALAWYAFALHLLLRAEPASAEGGIRLGRRGDFLSRCFIGVGGLGLAGVAFALLTGHGGADGALSLASPGVALRLMLALAQLLLLENLYRNTESELRWNVVLACLGLGGLAAYDLVLCADAALLHRVSPALVNARPAAALLVCPLLAMAAARNRAWAIDIHVSRTAMFHTATLVVSGGFLLAVALSAELAQRIGGGVDAHWGGVARVSVLFAGCLSLAVLLTSGSARGLLRAGLVDHFFTHRYDYREEWRRCIDTLSDITIHNALHGRVVRALAQVVDSPAGMLLLREPGALGLHWSESWNLPQLPGPLPPGHPLSRALESDAPAIELPQESSGWAPLSGGLGLWLAIPLRESGRLSGCVLVARPRAPFRLDAEVFGLLGVVAHEVATHLAEQRALRGLLETRELRAYGERFAFVAHDIKNVASQLSLLLSNAETHLADPDFQHDMLVTVQASVQKIGALIRRLEAPDPAASAAPPGLIPAERLEAVAQRMRSLRGAAITVDHGGAAGPVAMDPAVFDTIVTHLLDNAIEAAGTDRPVRLLVREEGGRALVDVADAGPGMAPEFVRDHLFAPFRTSKRHGSGIGAFQARALLRAASGDLLVLSEPGAGTTMRLLLPLAVAAPARLSA